MIHHVRIIPLDDRPRFGPQIDPGTSDSRGRWERDTAVRNTLSGARPGERTEGEQ